MAERTSYTCTLDADKIARLKRDLQARGFIFREIPYTHFGAEHRGEKVNVAVYTSGKLVVQGKGTTDFVQFYLEPQLLGEAKLGYEHILDPTMLEPRIGVDESGKGDFFGPLVIAGAWDARYDAKFQIPNSKSSIMFLHNIADADLPALYAGATVFVMPSLYEGFGLTPLEAMACGAPVICSNASSLPEVMGDAGLLPDPASVPDIAAALEKAHDDADFRRRAAEEGPRRARTFTWAAAAVKTRCNSRTIISHLTTLQTRI